MSDDKEFKPAAGGSTAHTMMRCGACQRWWSVASVDGLTACPCGGALVSVDWDAHMKALPDGTIPPDLVNPVKKS